MSKDIPFVGFGNDELDALSVAGERILCKRCGKEHTIMFGAGEDGKESKSLGFVRCGRKMYVATIKGKEL